MEGQANTLRIAAYASDPPALDTLNSFDPESFALLSLINDALIYIDTQGQLQPALATGWERESALCWRFHLKPGLTFHNGDPFGAQDVVATFRAHLNPEQRSITGCGIFAPVKACTLVDEHTVRFETHFPDAMLLERMLFSQIYPRAIMDREDAFQRINAHPVGTGAYRLVAWEKGRQVVLERFEGHWARRATVQRLIFPIIRQTEWVDCLRRGEVDLALNVDAHDARRVEQEPGLRVMHQEASLAQVFMLRQRGPLADLRVRRALNHAIHQALICEVAEHGKASSLASLLTPGQFGFHDKLKPYTYDPEHARRLLSQAGYAEGFTLKGLVSSTSAAVFHAVKEFLARVGVKLEAEIAPRGEWMRRIVVNRMLGLGDFDGDFALTNVDNPTNHGLFHHYIALFSQGPFSLGSIEGYDQEFLKAATAPTREAAREALQELERYCHEQALMLFTTNQHVHAVARRGVSLQLPRSGHFNYEPLWSLTCQADAHTEATPYKHVEPEHRDVKELLEATGYPSVYYRAQEEPLQHQAYARLWAQLQTSQERWQAQLEPMFKALVDQAEARNHLSNVMSSTERVGILGQSHTGRRLFINEGYAQMVDPQQRDLEELSISGAGIQGWQDVRDAVDQRGAWNGAVTIDQDKQLYLNASPTRNEFGVAHGYTFVFSDFSGEEERIRSQAIRRILDHVPYGLFSCDAQGCILPGYSRSCDSFFQVQGESIEGTPVWEALGLGQRDAWHLEACLEQTFDDWMPEEVALSQLPSQAQVGGRSFALNASLIRDEQGQIEAVLFSVLDVTALREAQREVERIHGVMAVMRDRDRFLPLANSFLEMLQSALSSDLGDAQIQSWLRRELHTFKGAFGLFRQEELAHQIHLAEDHDPVRRGDLANLHDDFVYLLEENAPYWKITPGRKRDLSIRPQELTLLKVQVAAASTVSDAIDAVERFALALHSQPARALLGPMEETCQRIAKQLGKEVELIIEGDDTLVPESAEPLFRALPHLLRNALDHGLEPPEQRGHKPPRGALHLQIALDEAGQLQIHFRDDGRGIDLDKLVRRAVDQGTLAPQEAQALSGEQRQDLLFCDGLSTAEQVSDISGRGIGMGAVKRAVEEMGGRLSFQTRLGQGTTWSLELPLAA